MPTIQYFAVLVAGERGRLRHQCASILAACSVPSENRVVRCSFQRKPTASTALSCLQFASLQAVLMPAVQAVLTIFLFAPLSTGKPGIFDQKVRV